MPKITLAQKARIVAKVNRRTTDGFHTAVHQEEAAGAEEALEKDLSDLES